MIPLETIAQQCLTEATANAQYAADILRQNCTASEVDNALEVLEKAAIMARTARRALERLETDEEQAYDDPAHCEMMASDPRL